MPNKESIAIHLVAMRYGVSRCEAIAHLGQPIRILMGDDALMQRVMRGTSLAQNEAWLDVLRQVTDAEPLFGPATA